MKKVSAEKAYKELYPRATCERHKPTFKPAYFLVRKKGGDFMWHGCGDTRAQAFADALEKHESEPKK